MGLMSLQTEVGRGHAQPVPGHCARAHCAYPASPAYGGSGWSLCCCSAATLTPWAQCLETPSQRRTVRWSLAAWAAQASLPGRGGHQATRPQDTPPLQQLAASSRRPGPCTDSHQGSSLCVIPVRLRWWPGSQRHTPTHTHTCTHARAHTCTCLHSTPQHTHAHTFQGYLAVFT